MNSKNVWIICHYAQQPPLNTMLRYHNWGKELVKRGYSVTIVAASTIHNTNIDIVEQNGKIEDICDGIHYKYINTPKYSGNGMQRIKNMLAFCFGLKSFRKETPSVIINCEAYLFPFVKHYFKNIPVITDTVDLWPESIIEYAGYSKKNPLIRVLYRLERNAYLKSDAMIFSMEGGKDYLREQSYSNKINYSKVFHINMGCDLEAYNKCLKDFSEELPWDMNKFNIVYCGSIRSANQVNKICEAAKKIHEEKIDNVDFQIYGNGDQLENLKDYVAKNQLNNIHFFGRFKKEQIPGILVNADASLLTYKQVNLMKYGGSQSKLFDYLASGTPIICNAKWGYNLIDRYYCGVVTEDQTPESFVKAIKYLFSLSDEEITQMGENGRKVAEMYDQPELVDKLCEVINFVVK
ncbi:MAG: glycosyltransferase family 4 protein [Treponemataceae bacterium]|nr:glycosyltransferase family 4 protein [Treponemataceae bacterium]